MHSLFEFILHVYYRLVNFAFAVYYRLFVGPSRPILFPSESDERDAIYFLSAIEAARRIRDGDLSSNQLVQAYAERIRVVDPQLNAVVHECYAAALQQADEVDEYLHGINRHSDEFKSLAISQPLLGVPFVVKNNLDVVGFVTFVGGSADVANIPATKDAFVVRRLRLAGAIPIAITSLPNVGVPGNPDRRNPYDLRRTCGGSSSGTGALVGVGAAIFGLGNDSGGSVRIPAAWSGCYGLKPTKGLIPLDGVVPSVDSSAMKELWTIGSLCRYAEDLPIILKCMLPTASDAGRLRLDEPVNFSTLRLLYTVDLGIPLCEPVQPAMRDAVVRVAKFFELRHGVDPRKLELPLLSDVYEMYCVSTDNDNKLDESWGKVLGDCWSILRSKQREKIDKVFHRFHAILTMPNAEARNKLIVKRDHLRAQLINLLSERGSYGEPDGDRPALLLLPAYPNQAFFCGEWVWKCFNSAYTNLFNTLGLPAITVPLGLVNGLPVAVQLAGAPYTEGLLIEAAKELERAFGGWRAPE